jgi:catechol 2,3-dioxygenase-like lactoylglutathione lyase family enzyme
VDAAFVHTGAGLRRWPDPRPDGRPPLDEEYSRRLDPGKYRLVLARADAWAAALTGLGLAAVRESPVPAAWQVRGRHPATRAVSVEPGAPDSLALHGVHWEVDQDEFVPVVQVRVGPEAVPVIDAPDCGCDACDDGSESLLRALDDAIVPVVTGDWLHLEAPGVTVTATADGWSAHGSRTGREISRLVEQARAGRSPYRVQRAARWW